MIPAAPSWPSVLGRLAAGLDLDADSARWALAEVMAGEATPAQIGALLLGLQAKGPTPEEVAAAADAMRAAALPVEVPGVLLDVVGTGGDSSGSVNFSTMAAIVAAACGATIVKHGNRAASSACGTADVLEELGVAIDLDPQGIASCARELGIAFAFAQVLHPALEDCPGHAIWKRDFTGAAGLFSVLFDPGYTEAQTDRFIDSLKLFKIGYSWGGANSLAVPYRMAQIRRDWPHAGQLVRFNIGLEEVQDLINDLTQAFKSLQ